LGARPRRAGRPRSALSSHCLTTTSSPAFPPDLLAQRDPRARPLPLFRLRQRVGRHPPGTPWGARPPAGGRPAERHEGGSMSRSRLFLATLGLMFAAAPVSAQRVHVVEDDHMVTVQNN